MSSGNGWTDLEDLKSSDAPMSRPGCVPFLVVILLAVSACGPADDDGGDVATSPQVNTPLTEGSVTTSTTTTLPEPQNAHSWSMKIVFDSGWEYGVDVRVEGGLELRADARITSGI
jgi:hypothetical protein